MKQYMRKHQTLEPIDPRITDRTLMPFVGENHGTSGPVRTSFNETKLPIEDDIVKAADQATGFTKKPVDPWSGDHIGFYNTLGAVTRTGPNKGKRSYAARGYYQPNEGRPNLRVITESLVSRVVLENATATGVEFVHNGQKHIVKAKREVIVTGGAINTPQILELSGIGDPEILKAAGVEVKVDLPSVGTNFQDHVVGLTSHELAAGQISGDIIHNPDVMAAAQKTLAEEQGGPLTGVQAVQGFFPVSMFLEDGELEEIVQSIEASKPAATAFQKKQWDQVIAHIKNPHSASLQFVLVGVTGDIEAGISDQSKLWPPPATPDQPHGISLAVCMQYPVARGTVHITSSDPATHPSVDPNYLNHPADVAVLAAGIKFAEKLIQAPAMEGKVSKRTQPDPTRFALDTVASRRAAVQEYCIGEYHACGSCAMGSTVDSRLRVYGVKGLRVADASVFANNVSGNIVSSVYAVAEKAADLIKQDWDYAALDKAAKA